MRTWQLIATIGRRALVAAALSLAVWAPAAAADWPVYGHDLSNSRNAGTEGPSTTQAATMSQAWQFKSPTGDFTGTPVIAGGVLVDGNNVGWVYALNAVTGDLIWSKNLGQPVTGTAAIDLRAPGGPTVYVPVAQLGSPRVVALSLANGQKRWDTVVTNQPNSSVFGSPTFWNGTVYIGTSGPNEDTTTARGSLVALNEATGAIRWQTFTVTPGHDGAAIWSTPAIDPATGRVYVGTGNNYHPPTTDTEDSIIAFDAATGQMLGHYQATSNDSFNAANNPAGPDWDFGASPNLFTGAGGRALVGDGQKSGTYWTLDRATLRAVWSASVGPPGTLGGILGSTAFDGSRIFAADTITGQVTALTTGGSSAWSSPDAGGLHLAALSAGHGVLYTSDDSGFMTARDAATGSILGKFSLGSPTFGGTSVVGRAVYVSVGTGPPPEPAPQSDGSGSVIAFGDTSASGGALAGGRRGTSSTTLPPAVHGCIRAQRFRFRLRRHGSIVKLVVFVNGRRRLVLRRPGRRGFTLRLGAGQKAVVKIVVTRRDRTQLITIRRYNGCGKGHGRKHVRHHRRHHR